MDDYRTLQLSYLNYNTMNYYTTSPDSDMQLGRYPPDLPLLSVSIR